MLWEGKGTVSHKEWHIGNVIARTHSEHVALALTSSAMRRVAVAIFEKKCRACDCCGFELKTASG